MQAFAADFVVFLLSCLAFVSCFESFDLLLSCLRSSTYLSSYSLFTLVPRFVAILLPFFMLGLAFPHLVFTTLKILQQVLSNKPLYCHLTSLAGFFYLFLLFGLLSNKTNYKQTYDITFMNYYLLASNYAQEEIDLSFSKYSCSTAVKLNLL